MLKEHLPLQTAGSDNAASGSNNGGPEKIIISTIIDLYSKALTTGISAGVTAAETISTKIQEQLPQIEVVVKSIDDIVQKINEDGGISDEFIKIITSVKEVIKKRELSDLVAENNTINNQINKESPLTEDKKEKLREEFKRFFVELKKERAENKKISLEEKGLTFLTEHGRIGGNHMQKGGKKIISRTHKSINQFLNPKITAANIKSKRFRSNKSKKRRIH